MRTLTLSLVLALAAAACGDDDGDSPRDPDANANQPDADPNRPDADPNKPDAHVAACDPSGGEPALALEIVTEDLSSPVAIATAPGDERIFVIEQRGRIRIVTGGQLVEQPFLDIDPLTDGGGERGLLNVAFHPNYAANRRFFIYYTNLAGNIEIAEHRALEGDPNRADPDYRIGLIEIPHPDHSNHNGGWLAFGPDGYLYAGTGDGGGGGDPDEHGQDTDVLLGKILRLDIDVAEDYEPAPGNPFLDGGGRPEIWAYGVRNPWRSSFDRMTGDLYIADVGQDAWEEINVQPAAAPGGENYGWDAFEGDQCYDEDEGCVEAGKVFPIHVYAHAGENKSVTGGYVYRGSCMPGHQGKYFFADYYGETFSLEWTGGAAAQNVQRWESLDVPGTSSFGQDRDGELYMASHFDGILYKIVPGE